MHVSHFHRGGRAWSSDLMGSGALQNPALPTEPQPQPLESSSSCRAVPCLQCPGVAVFHGHCPRWTPACGLTIPPSRSWLSSASSSLPACRLPCLCGSDPMEAWSPTGPHAEPGADTTSPQSLPVGPCMPSPGWTIPSLGTLMTQPWATLRRLM